MGKNPHSKATTRKCEVDCVFDLFCLKRLFGRIEMLTERIAGSIAIVLGKYASERSLAKHLATDMTNVEVSEEDTIVKIGKHLKPNNAGS